MKLLVVFTGGTIGCSVDQEGYFSPDQKNGYKLISLFQEAKKADPETREDEIVIDTVEPYSTLSEQLNSTFVQKLIDCVKSNAEKEYDGIIVTHGTDTLQYAACALGYALGNSSIPVLLVSSNYILDDPKMNGLENFIAAVDFIKGGYGKGVFVAYKNKQEGVTIHRGTRMDAHHTFDSSAGGYVITCQTSCANGLSCSLIVFFVDILDGGAKKQHLPHIRTVSRFWRQCPVWRLRRQYGQQLRRS